MKVILEYPFEESYIPRSREIEDIAEYNLKPSDWKLYEIPLGYINQCAQARPVKNSRQNELTSSLKTGQESPISFTIIDKELLNEYIQFTNRIWGASVDISSFTPLPDHPDNFILLVAGHSRLQGFLDIAMELDEDPNNFTIVGRLREGAITVEDILDIQRKENIHTEVPPDREARIIAEDYIFQKEKNPKLTKKAFIESRGIPINRLNDYLGYVDLPPRIRKMTDDGALAFGVAVELGRAVAVLREEALRIKLDSQDTVSNKDLEIEEFITLELQRHIAMFLNDGNITSARYRIRHQVKTLKAEHEIADGKKLRKNEFLELRLFTLNDFESRIKYLKDQINRELEIFKSNKNSSLYRLYRSSLELMNLRYDIDEEIVESTKRLGHFALS